MLALLFVLALSCKKETEEQTGIVSLTIDNYREVEGATQAVPINLKIDQSLHRGGEVMVNVSGGIYGEDYETSAGSNEFSLTIAPNALFVNFSIQPIDDDLVEEDVQLTITLTSVSGDLELGTQTTTTLTILDDDDPQVAMIGFDTTQYTVAEEATDPALLVIAFDQPTTNGGQISIAAEGTAMYGIDYEIEGAGGNNFDLTVPAGAGSASFMVRTLDNDVFEEDKTVVFRLTATTGGLKIVNPDSTQLTIINDDEPIFPTINFEDVGAISISEAEETVSLNLLLSSALEQDATFQVDVDASSTAELGADFTINGQSMGPITVQMLAGATMSSIDLQAIDDSDFEGSETIVLNLTNPSMGLLLGVDLIQYTIELTDDDPDPAAINYLETFETFDGSGNYLTDTLGWQSFIINQTINPNQTISLITSAGSFSDADDVNAPSDSGLNLFYNSNNDPGLYGQIDNVVITPLLEGSGALQVQVDAAYIFKNQNSAEINFYYSETYDGSGTFNPADWTLFGTENVAQMDSEGFGNNAYKREDFAITTNGSFYIAIRIEQEINEENYRMRWRFDNLRVTNQ